MNRYFIYLIDGIFGSVAEIMSYLYCGSHRVYKISPRIFLVSILILAILSAYATSIESITLFLLNLIVLVALFKVDVIKLLRVTFVGLSFTTLFLSPIIVYQYLVSGYLSPEVFIGLKYGVLMILARSGISISYLSMIPLSLGLGGLINALTKLKLRFGVIITFLTFYRLIPYMLNDLSTLFIGRESRRIGRRGLVGFWRSISETLGEFLIRGSSRGYMVSIGFKSRLLSNKVYLVAQYSSTRYTLIYLAYFLAIISVFMVMVI